MISAEHLNREAERVHRLNHKWWYDANGRRIDRKEDTGNG